MNGNSAINVVSDVNSITTFSSYGSISNDTDIDDRRHWLSEYICFDVSFQNVYCLSTKSVLTLNELHWQKKNTNKSILRIKFNSVVFILPKYCGTCLRLNPRKLNEKKKMFEQRSNILKSEKFTALINLRSMKRK